MESLIYMQLGNNVVQYSVGVQQPAGNLRFYGVFASTLLANFKKHKTIPPQSSFSSPSPSKTSSTGTTEVDSAEATLPLPQGEHTTIASALHRRKVHERIAADERAKEELRSRLSVTEEQLQHTTHRCTALVEEMTLLRREKDAVENTYRVRDEQMREVAAQTATRLEKLEAEASTYRVSIKDSIHQHLFVGPENAAVLRSKRTETLDIIEYIQLRVFERMAEEYKSRDSSGIEVSGLLRDLEYARSEADRVKMMLEDSNAAHELLKNEAAKCTQRSAEKIQKLEIDYDELAHQMEDDKTTTRAAYKLKEDLEERTHQCARLEADRLSLAKQVETLEKDILQARRDNETDAHKVQHHATEVRYLAKENESLAARVVTLEEEKRSAQEKARSLQDVLQANLDKYGTDLMAVREKHDERLQDELSKLENTSTTEIRRIQEHTKAVADREYAQIKTEKELSVKEAQRLARRIEEVESESKRVLVEAKLAEERMRGDLSACRTDLKVKTLECTQLREVRQQNESSIEGLELDCTRLQKMLDTLKHEFFELQLQHSRQHEEMRARVTTLKEQLKIYEELETECDDAIENTGRLLTDGHSGEVAVQIMSHVPSSQGRRIQQSLLLAKRAMSLENQVATLTEELQQKTVSSNRVNAELNRVKGVMGTQGQPYQYFVDTLAEKDKSVEDLRKQHDLLSREVSGIKSERDRACELLTTMQSNMEVLKNQRDELSGYLQDHLEANKMAGGGPGGEDRAAYLTSKRHTRKRATLPAVEPPAPQRTTVIFGAPPEAAHEDGTSVLPQPFVISA